MTAARRSPPRYRGGKFLEPCRDGAELLEPGLPLMARPGHNGQPCNFSKR